MLYFLKNQTAQYFLSSYFDLIFLYDMSMVFNVLLLKTLKQVLKERKYEITCGYNNNYGFKFNLQCTSCFFGCEYC